MGVRPGPSLATWSGKRVLVTLLVVLVACGPVEDADDDDDDAILLAPLMNCGSVANSRYTLTHTRACPRKSLSGRPP
jgi:hypothetical protein